MYHFGLRFFLSLRKKQENRKMLSKESKKKDLKEKMGEKGERDVNLERERGRQEGEDC